MQFATSGYMDEFYNAFVKEGCEFPVSLVNVPENIAYILKVVSK